MQKLAPWGGLGILEVMRMRHLLFPSLVKSRRNTLERRSWL